MIGERSPETRTGNDMAKPERPDSIKGRSRIPRKGFRIGLTDLLYFDQR